MKPQATHQYVIRKDQRVKTETLFADTLINRIFSHELENAAVLYRLITSARFSKMLGFLAFDLPFGSMFTGLNRFNRQLGINLDECLDDPATFDRPRKLFERKIRYWETRPMPVDVESVVAPADAKVLVGSFFSQSALFIKEKFFSFGELIGSQKSKWKNTFAEGDFALFRLTPEKYHYNHLPVSGKVVDVYEVAGRFNPCNPGTVVSIASPLSKNKRVVTVIDTDVENGTYVGRVAMIEIVALMIGDIMQCYSEVRYDTPQNIRPGMFLKKGSPKSLFRPGSSTVLLVFQKNRIAFAPDIIENMSCPKAESRFSQGFGKSLVETEVDVRSLIGRRKLYPLKMLQPEE